jgi:hypothetical protein
LMASMSFMISGAVAPTITAALCCVPIVKVGKHSILVLAYRSLVPVFRTSPGNFFELSSGPYSAPMR